MNSIGEDCKELKHEYDACFNNWFADKFLKGVTDESMCAPLFRVYQQCVKVSPILIPSFTVLIIENLFQNAMKDQHIELKEVEITHLGSDKEFKAPDSSSSGSKPKTS